MSEEAPAIGGIAALAIDCTDPPGLAHWWSRLLGGTVEVLPQGYADNRRCLLAHAVLLLWTGHAPAGESVHAESEPSWMFRKVERILPSLSMRSTKALTTL